MRALLLVITFSLLAGCGVLDGRDTAKYPQAVEAETAAERDAGCHQVCVEVPSGADEDGGGLGWSCFCEQ